MTDNSPDRASGDHTQTDRAQTDRTQTDRTQAESGGPSGLHDYSAEHAGLRETHQHVHDGLVKADPTGSRGKSLLLAGFIIVMLLVLAAMLLIGTVQD